MKISFNKDENILMIEVSKKPIDFAEEMDGIVVHFSSDNKPVLLEILDASEFITKTTEATIKAPSGKLVRVLK